ncbi:MAG: isoprenylcysteine carboxylmethyltransferase family protein [Anaerolineales bacterium]|jgi:protein-S-isoprenylcysteine O-methyltransferase Ste14
MNTKLIVLYILDQILSIAGMGVALFWSAGRIDWWAAWAAIAVWLACFTAMDILILRLNPDLMAERLSPPRGAKSWDRAILSILRLTQLLRYILAGLDQRYGWTGGFPLAAQIAAMTVCVLSYALLAWAMASNTFFSQIVRIQSDRGHAVATGGPYRYVRHPAYVGMILFELAISTLLASWPAIIAGGLCAILLLLRTALEDRTLQAELTGYVEYARQVRYRLLPGIW